MSIASIDALGLSSVKRKRFRVSLNLNPTNRVICDPRVTLAWGTFVPWRLWTWHFRSLFTMCMLTTMMLFTLSKAWLILYLSNFGGVIYDPSVLTDVIH